MYKIRIKWNDWFFDNFYPKEYEMSLKYNLQFFLLQIRILKMYIRHPSAGSISTAMVSCCINDVMFKNCCFRGRLQWEEGTVYEGEFVKGRFEGYLLLFSHLNKWLLCRDLPSILCCFRDTIMKIAFAYVTASFCLIVLRYGQMTYPENTTNPVTKVYEGEWKDGKMNGYGKMRWSTIFKQIIMLLS